jgi:hypothetical protein
VKSLTNDRPRVLWVSLAAIVAASFAVRLAALAYWGTGTIESEGAEYAKIAENLRNGAGYVGLVVPGPQASFNLLFPLLIAATSFVTHSYESAGRVVALVLGGLLPLPVFAIASHLFNRRVGFIAAILSLLHPALVYLSFMVYSEGPYATLVLSAVFLVIRALEDSSVRQWLWVGAAFGVCYLLRAEATAAFAIAVLFALTATKGNLNVRVKRAVCAIAVFLVLALPQVIFLYKSTGRILLEGKSKILFSYTGRRYLAAEAHPGVEFESDGGLRDVPSSEPNLEGGYPAQWEGKWAFYGIDSQLRGTGTDMRSYADIARETKIRPQDLLPLVKEGVHRNLPALVQVLSSARWLGAPLLSALALLGVFRRPWRAPRLSARFFFLSVSLAPIVAISTVLWTDTRYYFIFVPILCIWAANGLYELSLWIKATSTAAGWSLVARPVVSQWILPLLCVLALVLGSVKPVKSNYIFHDSAPWSRVNREIGLWIGSQQNRQVRIMDLSLPLSYHADAKQLVYFPYCSGDLALRYLDAAQVDYIVLRRGEKFTKYYEDWVTRGVPDNRAELVQPPPLPGAEQFVIYRWHRSDRADSSRAIPE